jgi:septal ring factor EnvC (AmiA/AmiB activator)
VNCGLLRLLMIPLLLGAGLLQAQETPALAARVAAEQLEDAAVSLQNAKKSRDRVGALTETVQAYEAGLRAMRDGLRRASYREAQLSRELASQEGQIARLLGALQSLGRGPAPTMLLHPQGPTGTARSGMILADVAPALAVEAAKLRRDLEEVAILRSLQQGAADTLQAGLEGVQQARTELSKAIADRTELPKRFSEDPIQTALLIASTETLEGFASGLAELPLTLTNDIVLPDITEQKGQLAWPVHAQILRKAGEADAAGIRRPGSVLATRPRALVTTPVPATIRYRGPLLEYGNVMILEPRPGLLFVLAGMDVVYGETGQVLSAGSPVGLMGGNSPDVDAILSQSGEGSGAGAGQDRSETLYIEVREDNSTVDPETWFTANKDR